MRSRLIQVKWKNIINYHLLIFGLGSILYCISALDFSFSALESSFNRENIVFLLLLILIKHPRILSSLF
jgi:hypothetical protein